MINVGAKLIPKPEINPNLVRINTEAIPVPTIISKGEYNTEPKDVPNIFSEEIQIDDTESPEANNVERSLTIETPDIIANNEFEELSVIGRYESILRTDPIRVNDIASYFEYREFDHHQAIINEQLRLNIPFPGQRFIVGGFQAVVDNIVEMVTNWDEVWKNYADEAKRGMTDILKDSANRLVGSLTESARARRNRRRRMGVENVSKRPKMFHDTQRSLTQQKARQEDNWDDLEQDDEGNISKRDLIHYTNFANNILIKVINESLLEKGVIMEHRWSRLKSPERTNKHSSNIFIHLLVMATRIQHRLFPFNTFNNIDKKAINLRTLPNITWVPNEKFREGSPFQMINRIGPDFMKHKFEAMFIWDFMGVNQLSLENYLNRLSWLTEYEKYILSNKGFAVRLGQINVPPVFNEDFTVPFAQTEVKKIKSNKTMNMQSSFTLRLDQNLIWLDKINEIAGHKGGIDETFPMQQSVSHPYMRSLDQQRKNRIPLESNWRKVIKTIAKTWTSTKGRSLKDTQLSLVVKKVQLSNWLDLSIQQQSLSCFVFENIKILGTSDKITFNREGKDIQNMVINFIFKKCYQIEMGTKPINNNDRGRFIQINKNLKFDIPDERIEQIRTDILNNIIGNN